MNRDFKIFSEFLANHSLIIFLAILSGLVFHFIVALPQFRFLLPPISPLFVDLLDPMIWYSAFLGICYLAFSDGQNSSQFRLLILLISVVSLVVWSLAFPIKALALANEYDQGRITPRLLSALTQTAVLRVVDIGLGMSFVIYALFRNFRGWNYFLLASIGGFVWYSFSYGGFYICGRPRIYLALSEYFPLQDSALAFRLLALAASLLLCVLFSLSTYMAAPMIRRKFAAR